MLANSERADRVEPKSGGVRSLREFRKLVCVDTGVCLAKYSGRDSHGLVDWGSWGGCPRGWVISLKVLSYQAPLEWRWWARARPTAKLCTLSLFTCRFHPLFSLTSTAPSCLKHAPCITSKVWTRRHLFLSLPFPFPSPIQTWLLLRALSWH